MNTTQTPRHDQLNNDSNHGCRTLTRVGRFLAVPAIALTGGLIASAAPASAKQPPLSCGAVVTTDVRLSADLLDCPGAGLVIGAHGVTIDLAGHTIDGTGVGAGIDNEAGFDDVRVRRGTVQQFLFGVHLFETTNAQIVRVTTSFNIIGVQISSSKDVDIERVTSNDNRSNGVEITFSEDIVVQRSAAAGNGLFGIVDRFNLDTRHAGNVITGNLASGLVVDFTDGVVVERNESVGNAGDGIALTGVESATVSRNDVSANTNHGILIDRPGNVLTRNEARDNQAFGIAAPEGTIDGGRNRASGNVAGDCTGVTCR